MDLGRGALSLHLGALSYLFEPFQKFRTESSFILLYSMERLRMDPPPLLPLPPPASTRLSRFFIVSKVISWITKILKDW